MLIVWHFWGTTFAKKIRKNNKDVVSHSGNTNFFNINLNLLALI